MSRVPSIELCSKAARKGLKDRMECLQGLGWEQFILRVVSQNSLKGSNVNTFSTVFELDLNIAFDDLFHLGHQT